MKWKDGLRLWRKLRNIKEPQGAFVESIEEELTEYRLACKGLYMDKDGAIQEFATPDEAQHAKIDAIADILVFAANECELEGYDLDLVMKQVVKHISAILTSSIID